MSTRPSTKNVLLLGAPKSVFLCRRLEQTDRLLSDRAGRSVDVDFHVVLAAEIEVSQSLLNTKLVDVVVDAAGTHRPGQHD